MTNLSNSLKILQSKINLKRSELEVLVDEFVETYNSDLIEVSRDQLKEIVQKIGKFEMKRYYKTGIGFSSTTAEVEWRDDWQDVMIGGYQYSEAFRIFKIESELYNRIYS